MVGYTLKNVLSDYGSVSRGVATRDAEGYLKSMKEHTVIVREGEDLIDVMRSGQGVLNIVLSLGDIKSELDATIHQLHAPAEVVSYGGTPAVSQ